VLLGEGEGLNGKHEGGCIWSMYLIYKYEDRTLKPVKIILSSGEGDEEKWW
jgi:hypothetical protein